MNSLLKVRSLLVAITLISAAAPALAESRVGNGKVPQSTSCTCQENIFSKTLCPMIHCIDAVAFTSADQASDIVAPTTNPAVLVARDWFGWERQDRKPKA